MIITVGWLAGSPAAIYQSNSLFLSFETYYFSSFGFFSNKLKRVDVSISISSTCVFHVEFKLLHLYCLNPNNFCKFIPKTHFAKWLYSLCYGLHLHIRLTVYTCRIALCKCLCISVLWKPFSRCNRNVFKTSRWPRQHFPHGTFEDFLCRTSAVPFCTAIIPLPRGPFPAKTAPPSHTIHTFLHIRKFFFILIHIRREYTYIIWDHLTMSCFGYSVPHCSNRQRQRPKHTSEFLAAEERRM